LALGKWGELEEAFDKRLSGAIARLGVPSRDEVKVLQAKVETLTKHIEKLSAAAAKVAGDQSACGQQTGLCKACGQTGLQPRRRPSELPAKPQPNQRLNRLQNLRPKKPLRLPVNL
jgi:hypothetical protein